MYLSESLKNQNTTSRANQVENPPVVRKKFPVRRWIHRKIQGPILSHSLWLTRPSSLVSKLRHVSADSGGRCGDVGKQNTCIYNIIYIYILYIYMYILYKQHKSSNIRRTVIIPWYTNHSWFLLVIPMMFLCLDLSGALGLHSCHSDGPYVFNPNNFNVVRKRNRSELSEPLQETRGTYPTIPEKGTNHRLNKCRLGSGICSMWYICIKFDPSNMGNLITIFPKTPICSAPSIKPAWAVRKWQTHRCSSLINGSKLAWFFHPRNLTWHWKIPHFH